MPGALTHGFAFAAGGTATAALLALLRRLRPGRSTQPRFVQQPHPEWQPGQPQPPPYDAGDMVSLDPAAMAPAEVYPFVISAVVPRPVAFVTSQDAAGAINLAPFSYFNVMGHNPFVVAFGISRSPSRGGDKKDTLQNVEETGEFVVNIISDWYVEAANHTAGDFPRGANELALAGLTPVASDLVAPPRVGEAGVQLECRLRQVVDCPDSSGKPSSATVLGDVVRIHVARGVTGRTPHGRLVVDPVKLQPICRLGGFTYGRVTELFDIPRPDGQGRYPPKKKAA